MKTQCTIFARPLLAAATIALAACSLPNAPASKTAAVASGSFSSGEILQVLHSLNNGEIKQAELAEQQSNNEQVQNLAELLYRDHSRVNERVNQLVQSGIKLEKSPLSRGLTLQTSEIHDELSELSGKEFDCTYLDKQVAQHEIALDTVRNELKPGAEDKRVVELLDMVEPALKGHLQVAKASREEIGCTS